MLLDHHRAKIVAAEALVQILDPRIRPSSVVLCHGVFDVVHPGHLRHLLYAKSKAEVLVCSVTSDRCADKKGPYRPHVPQDLRAANLAVYDFVDYVVINDAAAPVDLITTLQPEFYAKGFEYSPSTRPSEMPETEAVGTYGGEVLFTPGDIVYSSSELIASAAPDLRWAKLEHAMVSADVSFDTLRTVLAQMHGQYVHVVGDVIVDRVTTGEVIGTSGKTPTLSVRRTGSEDFVGGVGIVAKHAHAAGARVQLTTVVGQDTSSEFVLSDLERSGVRVRFAVDLARPTTVKEAIVAGGYRLLKLDTVDNRPVSDAILDQLVERISETDEGAVVFSDFRHGIFNARTIPVLCKAIPSGIMRAADSQVASRWGNVADFKGFNLLTPNEREARFALGDQDSGVRPLAARLREEAQCQWLLMKMGERGVLGFGVTESLTLDSFAGPVKDAVGSGDAFLAYSTLALLVRPSLTIAAILGSFAAGIECSYDGNVPVTADHVLAVIDEAEKEIG